MVITSFLLIIFDCINFFEELGANYSRMEVKENCQRKSDALNDDPRHESKKVGFNEAGSNLILLEDVDAILNTKLLSASLTVKCLFPINIDFIMSKFQCNHIIQQRIKQQHFSFE
jgi:hypothetical protein